MYESTLCGKEEEGGGGGEEDEDEDEEAALREGEKQVLISSHLQFQEQTKKKWVRVLQHKRDC